MSSWQGCGPGEPARLTALIEGCGLRARPLRQARGWGYQRMSALGTILVLDAAPPPPQKIAEQGSASTLAFELSDGGQRLVVNCGGPGRFRPIFPTSWSQGLRTTAAHSTLVLADTNSTNIHRRRLARQGRRGRRRSSRSEDNDASRLEASHDGYVRAFGLIHKRSLMLGNDGKELRGADQLIAKGRKKIREFGALCRALPSRAGSRGDDHRRRHGRDPPLRRARRRGTSAAAAATSALEESLWIDGRGQPQRTTQLVIVGEVSALGGEIGWQFRRAS